MYVKPKLTALEAQALLRFIRRHSVEIMADHDLKRATDKVESAIREAQRA